MTPERFEALADAYGGDVTRWPEAEREAAALVMAADPARAQAILAAARALDARLDAWAAPGPSAALIGAVLASAPRPRGRFPAWLTPAGLGAGLAAACAAGVMLGAQLVSPAVAVDSDGDALVTAVGEDLYGLDDLDEDA